MREIERLIDYQFKDIANLKTALTHSSYIKEKSMPRTMCNERLEFLGDAILGAIVCEELYKTFPEEREGKLTKLKTDIVRANSLAKVAREIGLGKHLLLGNGEILTKGYDKESILENAMEAVIGAIFVESGYETTALTVKNILKNQIEQAVKGEFVSDYKSAVQEMLQKEGQHKMEYKVVKEEGQNHDKTFYVEFYVNGKSLGKGKGKSKKIAENNAAKEAVENLKQ